MKTAVSFIVAVFLFVSAGITTSQCSQKEEVSKENISRVVKTLSSDDLKGRAAFSPEAAKAANFLANEYRNIGLSTLDSLEDYYQEFTIYSITPSNVSITVDNKNVDEEKYFVNLHTKTISWNNSNVETFQIAKGEAFRAKQLQFANDGISSVVFIDKSHKKWFNRYRRYFSQPNRTFELDEAENDIFILHTPAFSSFEINIENDIETIELKNVTGKIEGRRSDEIVIFSAHYDHIGVTTPVDGDSIANGANDNASGVAAVIELARFFKAQPKPERTLIFVNFTAEEVGGYGSIYFSKQLNPDDIVAMFNIEMIGKPAIHEKNSAWITGYNLSDFGDILQKSMEGSDFVFYPDPYPRQNLFYRSDNATLARLGVPAHTISTTPIDMDEDYHKVSDESKTIDIPHITRTTAAIAEAANTIISGEETPSRINPEIVN